MMDNSPMKNPEFLEIILEPDAPLIPQLELIAKYENTARTLGYVILHSENYND